MIDDKINNLCIIFFFLLLCGFIILKYEQNHVNRDTKYLEFTNNSLRLGNDVKMSALNKRLTFFIKDKKIHFYTNHFNFSICANTKEKINYVVTNSKFIMKIDKDITNSIRRNLIYCHKELIRIGIRKTKSDE